MPAQRAEPTARSSRVEPSMSVKRKVTDGPVGSPMPGTSWHRRGVRNESVDGRPRLRPTALRGDPRPDRIEVDDAVVGQALEESRAICLVPLELAGRPPEPHPDLRQRAPGEV